MLTLKRILIKDHLSPPLRHLYSHTIIRGLATGLVGFFIPLFLFKIFGKIEFVILYYIATHGLSLLLYPLLTKILLRFDLKKLMIAATPFLVLYLLVMNQMDKGEYLLFWIGLAIFSIIFYRLLYWVPYHTDFANFTEKHYRGRELSIVQAIISLLGISLPAISGFIIIKLGFDWLFWIALLIHLISIIPLLKIPTRREKFSYNYFETWKKLFSKKNSHILIAYFADGFQGAAGYVIWPIFIFLILKGEYLSVGMITTLITLVTVALRLIIGDLSDHKNKHKLLKTGSLLFAIGWVIKTFVETAFQIFFIGAYHGMSEVLMRTPFDTLMYDKAADKGHYIDEYTVLREMALYLGRITLLILALIILSFAPVSFVFVIVALVSLLVNLI